MLGITGVVITLKPGVIVLNHDLPDEGFKSGDRILTYAYRGEGTSAVSFHGNYFSDFDIGFAKWPNGAGCRGANCAGTYLDRGRKAWWAQVKLTSGTLGWVDMIRSDFAGTCALE